MKEVRPISAPGSESSANLCRNEQCRASGFSPFRCLFSVVANSFRQNARNHWLTGLIIAPGGAGELTKNRTSSSKLYYISYGY